MAKKHDPAALPDGMASGKNSQDSEPRQARQRFKAQRKEDKLLLPLMIGAFLLIAVPAIIIGLLVDNAKVIHPTGIVLGALAVFVVFNLRTRRPGR